MDYMEAVNNMAIWIDANGSDYSWSHRTRFDEYVQEKLRPMHEEVSNIQEQIDRHHIKTIKGRKYWYQWEDGKWTSRGTAEGKEDPRTPLKDKRAKLEEKIKALENDIRSCVVKKSGKHLVIDVAKFKQHADKKLPEDVIMVSEILGN